MINNRITQSSLSAKTGIKQTHISVLLNSKDIKISKLKKICEALELPMYYFFDLYEDPKVKSLQTDIIKLNDIIQDKERIIKLLENQNRHYQFRK